MKSLRESGRLFVVCYVVCLLERFLIHKFAFQVDYLYDSLIAALGITVGWYLVKYFDEKRKNA
jgi:hypothetical protein